MIQIYSFVTNSSKGANKLDNCKQVQLDNAGISFHFGLQLRLLPVQILSENGRSQHQAIVDTHRRLQNDKNTIVPWY